MAYWFFTFRETLFSGRKKHEPNNKTYYSILSIRFPDTTPCINQMLFAVSKMLKTSHHWFVQRSQLQQCFHFITTRLCRITLLFIFTIELIVKQVQPNAMLVHTSHLILGDLLLYSCCKTYIEKLMNQQALAMKCANNYLFKIF
jgi:hypothetical protein